MENTQSENHPPCLFDKRYQQLYQADKNQVGGDEALFCDWCCRVFIGDLLIYEEISQAKFAKRIGKSASIISELLSPKPSRVSISANGDEKRVKERITFPSNFKWSLADGLMLLGDEKDLFIWLLDLEELRRSLKRSGIREADRDLLHREIALLICRIDSAWAEQNEGAYLNTNNTIKYIGDFGKISIREMVGLSGFTPDPKWIQAHLIEPANLSLERIQEYWDELLRMELVHLGSDGIWRRGPNQEIHIGGGGGRNAAIQNFYRCTLEAAASSLKLDSSRRHFRCRTITVPRGLFEADKEKLQVEVLGERFQEFLNGIEETLDGEGEIVMHLQLAAFPLADVQGEV